jgi:hypothetical protein
MLKRWLVLLLALAVALPRPALAADVDTDLATGVRQAQEGDFENAVTTLDSVVRRLTGQPSRAKDLARAYTYLSIAYLGLSQEQTAKAKFLEAWKADQSMELSPRDVAAARHGRHTRPRRPGEEGRIQDRPHPHRGGRAGRSRGRRRRGRRG